MTQTEITLDTRGLPAPELFPLDDIRRNAETNVTVLGRLLGPTDDGPQAAGAAVLTHRFWTTTLGSDPSVIGKVVRFDERTATHDFKWRGAGRSRR